MHECQHKLGNVANRTITLNAITIPIRDAELEAVAAGHRDIKRKSDRASNRDAASRPETPTVCPDVRRRL